MEINFKTWFFENNKSGWKTRADLLGKKEPEIYNKIIKFKEENNIDVDSFSQLVWLFINDVKEVPKCGCGKPCKYRETLKKGFHNYCSLTCFNEFQKTEDGVKYVKSKIKEKYGVESTNQLDSVKEKKIQSSLKKYGVRNPSQLKEVIEKTKQTVNERYGVDNVLSSEEHRKKMKETTIERYGVENVFASKEIQKKIKKHYNDKYGVDYYVQTDVEKKRRRNLFKERINNKINNLIDVNDDVILAYCDNCNEEYEINRALFSHRDKVGSKICTNCNPTNIKTRSEFEIIVENFLNKNKIKHIINDRVILGRKEIDVLIPDLNIGIEFNGLYWHSEKYKNKKYHINKTIEAKRHGINLIHFFEDEWVNDRDKIFNYLTHLTKKDEDVVGKIDFIDYNQSKKFIDNFSFKKGVGNLNVGVFNKQNELVFLVSFNKQIETEIEIVNIVKTKYFKNNEILLKIFNFIKNGEKIKMIKYTHDIRFLLDDYILKNFTLEKHIEPKTYYIKNNKRKKFTHNSLRIWNCGYDVYVMNCE